MEIFRNKGNGVAFSLILQPRSSFSKLSGIQGDALKLRVTSSPVDNRANLECIKYLSKVFSVPKSDVEIVQGHKSRHKQIFIKNIDAQRASQIVEEHLVD